MTRQAFAKIVLLVALGLVAISPAGAQEDRIVKAFDYLGADLIEALDAKLAEPEGSPSHPFQLFVWPFEPSQTPINIDEARRLRQLLEQALLRHGGNRYALVDLRAVIPIIEARPDYLMVRRNPVMALNGETSLADIVITGNLDLRDARFSARFRAARITDGEILAAAQSEALPLTEGMRAELAQTQSLGQAMQELGEALCDQAPDLQVLASCGMTFETTGQATDFAKWVEGQAIDALRNACSNILTERRLRIQDPPTACQALTDEPGGQVHTLSGQYWDLGAAVELVFTLRDPEGGELSRRYQINPSTEAAGFSLRPSQNLQIFLQNEARGPIDFWLETDRGLNPLYTVGEELRLRMRVDRPAYVQCYYRDRDNTVFKILPNPYQPEAWLEPGEIHTVPDASWPFLFELQPPVGQELVKCFASREPLDARLPEAMRASDLTPLPPRLAERFHEIIRARVPNHLTEQSIVINTEY